MLFTMSAFIGNFRCDLRLNSFPSAGEVVGELGIALAVGGQTRNVKEPRMLHFVASPGGSSGWRRRKTRKKLPQFSSNL